MYLGDTFRSSFQRVIERSNPELSILVGLFLAGLLLFCFRGALAYASERGRWILAGRTHRIMWTSATAAAVVVLFALGFDWLRWITTIGFAALLAGASIVAIDGRTARGDHDGDPWHRALPSTVTVSARGVAAVAVATYLLVLPPLPNFVSDVVSGARLLLDVPQ